MQRGHADQVANVRFRGQSGHALPPASAHRVKAAVGENGAAFGLAKRNDTYFLPFVSGASKIELTASLEMRPSTR